MFLRIIILSVILLLKGSNMAWSQVNLVRNGGFETYSSCPTNNNGDEIIYAIGWTPIDTTKYPDGLTNHMCTADYCHECGSGFYGALPLNSMGYQYPHDGKGMAAVWMYTDRDATNTNDYLRDYLFSKLSQKLTAGKRYCVTFYVVLAETAQYAVKEIGAYFDNGSIITTSTCGMPKPSLSQQVKHSGAPISDTMLWTRIEGSFVANGTEQFITIGNFHDKAGTTVINLPDNGVNQTHGTYYFVDDVSVVESGTPASAGPDTHVGYGDSVFIGRTDAAMDCSWTVLGSSTVIGKGAGIWVKPTVTTSYVVTQTLCGAVTKDTVRVEVWAAGVQSVRGQTQQYTMSPVPARTMLTINQSVVLNCQADATILDATGRTMLQQLIYFKDGSASLPSANLDPGFYLLHLKTTEGQISILRFVKE